MSLSGKRELFCREYAIDQNGTAAAIRAGYSKNAAGQQASRLLRDARIKARISQLLTESLTRLNIDLDRVTAELGLIAFSSMGDFSEWTEKEVKLKASSQLSEESKKVIEFVGETSAKDGSPQLKIKLHSKLRALEILVKIFEIKEVEARLAAIEEQLKVR